MDIADITYTDENGDEQNALAYLMKDGNLGVPGGRYGNDTESCATIALLLFLAYVNANGEGSVHVLDGSMSMVVNSSDEVAWSVLDNAHAFEGLTVTYTYKGTTYVEPLDPKDYFDAEEIEYARELYTAAYCGQAPSF